MASSRLANLVLRSAGFRRLSSSAGVWKGHSPLPDRDLGSVARTVVGIMAVGGGLWLIPTSSADSGLSFAAAAAADAGSGFVQQKKHRFVLGGWLDSLCTRFHNIILI